MSNQLTPPVTLPALLEYMAGILTGAPDGSSSNPAFSFASQQNTGIYRTSDGGIGIAVNGVVGIEIDKDGSPEISIRPDSVLWTKSFPLSMILSASPLSPLLFGAAGDGVTDDTTAIKSAITSGATYLASGTYLISDWSIIQETASWTGPGVLLCNGVTIPVGPLISPITLPVPSLFPDISSAVKFAQSKSYIGGSTIATVSIAKGSYGSALSPIDQIEINYNGGEKRIAISGESGVASDVHIYFDATSNKCGFLVNQGASVGLISNLTIEGVGGWVSHGVWGDQVFGGGILANGGGVVTTVDNVDIVKFYYGVSARDGSYIGCSSTVSVTEAGDVGFHAYNGSTIVCSGATASNCSHVTPGLGGGFCAELGSSMHCENATSSGNNIAGFTAQTGSSMWAQGSKSSSNGRDGYYANAGGQLIADSEVTSSSNGRNGFYAIGTGSFISCNGATSSGNTGGGFYAEYNAWIDITVAVAENNNGDGFHAKWGSTFSGNGSKSNSNGECGYYCGYNSSANINYASSNGNGQWGFLAEYNSVMNVYSWGSDGKNKSGDLSPAESTLGNVNGFISILQQ